MNEMVGQSILEAYGFAVFERVSPGCFRPTHRMPKWWCQVDPMDEGPGAFRPAGRFPFLENFLIDAEEFWQQRAAGRLDSGIWEMDAANSSTMFLEAAALYCEGTPLLVIRHAGAEGSAWQALLQRSRATHLEFLRDVARRKQLALELRSAREAARRLDRAKTEFLGNVSHELRTPLTAICGGTEMLLDSEMTAEQREQLEMVARAAQALLTIVNELLDLTRIEAGKLTVRVTAFELPKLLADLRHDFVPAAREKGIELRHEFHAALPRQVYGDDVRVRQALNNLLDNAIKFTTVGTVTLSVAPDQQDAEWICFAVTDTGPGMSAEQQQIVFDAFSQGDQTITRRYGGTGLGLSIASKLVDGMGGSLKLASREGAGSTFSFRLPLRRLPAITAREATTSAAVCDVEPPPPDGPALRVLVAEDNPVNRSFLEQVLGKAGHEVMLVEDGRQVLQAVQDNGFDVLLMDCQMPVMSGIEAALEIRRQEQRDGGHLPMIAVSAHAMPEDAQRCLAAGMDDYISKPFRGKELLAKMQRVAGLKRRPAVDRAGEK